MAAAIVIAAFLILTLWLSRRVIAAWSTPLSAIPNAHFTAPFSGLWSVWTKATGQEYSARLAAHRRLGPIIRLGPHEIGIDCFEDGVRTVYGRSWDKVAAYESFENYGYLPLFAISQAKPHAERRRVFANVFSKSTINSSAEFRKTLDVVGSGRLQPRLQKAAKDHTPLDMFSITREYSMDIVTAYTFGLDNCTNWLENSAEASYYLSAYRDTVEPWAFFALQEFPWFVEICRRIGINIVSPSFFSSMEIVQKFAFDVTSNAIKHLQVEGKSSGISARSLHQIWNRMEGISDTQKVCLLASDAFDQLHAGHESPGNILSYMMWKLSTNHEIQDKLRDELRSLREAGNPPEDSSFLDDVLTETIRLYPPAGGPFCRRAPQNAKLVGFDIPEKTIVSALPFTLGRNPKVFPEPESWLPQRWSGVSEEGRRQMKEWVWAFISGSRVCIGEYLAIRAMKSFTVQVYVNYRTTIATESDMRQLETFAASPAGLALDLILETY